MNTKRIVSILLILSMFMAILPKFSIAASNLGKFLSNKTFDEYAEDEEFKYQFVEHEKGDKKANITSPFYLLGNYGLNKQNDINDEDHRVYWYRLLSNKKVTNLDEDYMTIYKPGKSRTANNIEAYLFSFADTTESSKDTKAASRLHDKAQKAWWEYQEGDDDDDLLNKAYKYEDWVEQIEDVLGKDIEDAENEEIRDAIKNSIQFDTKDSVVSVVHEDDQDYILVSNLEVTAPSEYCDHEYEPDKDGDLDCTGDFHPGVSDISITFTTKDGTKTVSTNDNREQVENEGKLFGNIDGLENAILFEYMDYDSHVDKSDDYLQDGPCDADEDHRKFPNLTVYPFPFDEERFNLKFSAEFIKKYNITGIEEINIVSDGSRGILKAEYTELEEDGDVYEDYVYDEEQDFDQNDADATWYEEISVDTTLTTKGALGFSDDTKTLVTPKVALGMTEKTVEDYTQVASVDKTENYTKEDGTEVQVNSSNVDTETAKAAEDHYPKLVKMTDKNGTVSTYGNISTAPDGTVILCNDYIKRDDINNNEGKIYYNGGAGGKIELGIYSKDGADGTKLAYLGSTAGVDVKWKDTRSTRVKYYTISISQNALGQNLMFHVETKTGKYTFYIDTHTRCVLESNNTYKLYNYHGVNTSSELTKTWRSNCFKS